WRLRRFDVRFGRLLLDRGKLRLDRRKLRFGRGKLRLDESTRLRESRRRALVRRVDVANLDLVEVHVLRFDLLGLEIQKSAPDELSLSPIAVARRRNRID